MTEGKSKAYISHTGNGYAISLLGSNEILKSGDYNILTDEELDAEREQIAAHAWKDGKGWFGDNNDSFEQYWQQKQKERIG